MKVFCDLDLDIRMYSVPLYLRERLDALDVNIQFSYGENISNQTKMHFDIYWGNRPPENLFEIQKNIKWIHLGCVGIDRIQKIRCLRKDLLVTNSPGSATKGVANHTMYQIMNMYRQGSILHKIKNNIEIIQGRKLYDQGFFDVLNDKKVTIVGYGDIGRELRKYLEAFNCNIIGVASKARNEQIKIYEIKDLLKAVENADIVIGLLPEKEELKQVFNQTFFNSFCGDLFINNGRASHVNESALLKALNKNIIKGAALDNYQPDGAIARSEKKPNLLLSPHIAVCNPNYWEKQTKLFTSNLKKFQSGNIKAMHGMVNLNKFVLT